MKTIEELQHEYLGKLICINKTMTIKQAIYRLELMNMQYARVILAKINC
jgi:flagellar motility protein MotE (MotC chaperone)